MEIKFYITVKIPDEKDTDFEHYQDNLEDEFRSIVEDYECKVLYMEIR